MYSINSYVIIRLQYHKFSISSSISFRFIYLIIMKISTNSVIIIMFFFVITQVLTWLILLFKAFSFCLFNALTEQPLKIACGHARTTWDKIIFIFSSPFCFFLKSTIQYPHKQPRVYSTTFILGQTWIRFIRIMLVGTMWSQNDLNEIIWLNCLWKCSVNYNNNNIFFSRILFGKENQQVKNLD